MVQIRKCTTTEVTALQNLNNEVFINNVKYDNDLDLQWATSEKAKMYFTELLKDENALCLIAEDGDRKIGYLVAREKEIDYRKSSYFEIENMGVSPDYRSQGIGKLLMEECFGWAKVKGFKKAFINAYIQNVDAINFYKKNGFVEITKRYCRGR
jgi:ribosomal protein S18 acetylase RimI-like enzyme